jgi:cellulose 1,4-beta-cellobiosidase
MRAAALFALACQARGQGRGKMQEEEGIPIGIKKCDASGHCEVEDLKVTIDANWRWVHLKSCDETKNCGQKDNCYLNNTWMGQCRDGQCETECSLEGQSTESYNSTFGISPTEGNTGLRMGYVTKNTDGENIGSRMYVLDETSEKYKQFFILNKEIAIDYDLSTAGCGLNAAVYFAEMDPSGDMGGANEAGAKYGTGYCDAQCPNDLKFIKGRSNNVPWKPNEKDPSNNTGIGPRGLCCMEMDLFESNEFATVFTAHPANQSGQVECSTPDMSSGCNLGSTPGYGCGSQDGDRTTGQTDRNGCDVNPYRLGDTNFFGPGTDFTLNSLKPFTAVTQFHTADQSDTGELVKITQFYFQEGKKIEHPKPTWKGMENQEPAITQDFCEAVDAIYDHKPAGTREFLKLKGLKAVGESLARGATLVLSFWDDAATFMNWLDASAGDGGPARGPCTQTAGDPKTIRSSAASSHVTYTNIRYGPLGSTKPPSPGPAPTPPPQPPVPGAPCCSWAQPDQEQVCGKTTAYCETKEHCEGDCGGHWIPAVSEIVV